MTSCVLYSHLCLQEKMMQINRCLNIISSNILYGLVIIFKFLSSFCRIGENTDGELNDIVKIIY